MDFANKLKANQDQQKNLYRERGKERKKAKKQLNVKESSTFQSYSKPIQIGDVI
jgi:hypothetical protein